MSATLTDKEFEQFQSLIYQQVGITLDTPKKTLLTSRLGKRLRELQLPSYQAYYDRVSAKGGEEELTKLVDLISTNKTDFFREPVHFDFLTRAGSPSSCKPLAPCVFGRRLHHPEKSPIRLR